MIILRMHQQFLSISNIIKPIKKRRLLLCCISFFLILLFSPCSYFLNAQQNPFVVVLDAGHGGHDSGNRGNGYSEKKIALSIALKIGNQLEKNPDIKVIYTRKKDVFVDLIERANIANRADADLFISIHCDAFSSSRAYGAGTFVLGLHANERNFQIAKKENSVIFLEENYEQNYDGFDPNDPESVISLILMQETYLDQSIAAANTIQKSFVRNLNRKDRTVKQAGFVVLKYTYMPSVLVETGFLTNSSEGAFLNSSKGQIQMGRAIAKAILNYKNELQAAYQKAPLIVDNEGSAQNKIDSEAVVFKIQISASRKKIETKPYNFKGLNSISREKNGALYRYYFNNTTSYQSAQNLLRKAKNSGFSNAFIVAFSNGKKIKLSEALKLLE